MTSPTKDHAAAFDSLIRPALFNLLLERGVAQSYVTALRNLYGETPCHVRWGREVSEEFVRRRGTVQGSRLSPKLFSVVVDHIYKCSLRDVGEAELLLLLFADDGCIISRSADPVQLQNLLDRINARGKVFGLQMNPRKCQVLSTQSVQLRVDGEALPQVPGAKYLGMEISITGTIDAEITARVSAARRAFLGLSTLWREKRMRMREKCLVYSLCVRGVLLYQTAVWQLSRRHLQQLLVLDRWCLRYILRGWERDRRGFWRSWSNRKLYKQAALPCVQKSIKKSRLSWIGHVARMSDERLPKRIMGEFVRGTSMKSKKRGRPAVGYLDLLKADLNLPDLNPSGLWHRIKQEAGNRKTWARKLH